MSLENNVFHKDITMIRYWYHGTTSNNARNIINDGINVDNVNVLNGRTPINPQYQTSDYGPGFYLTSNKKQAIKWAYLMSDGIINTPSIIRIDLFEFFKHASLKIFHTPNKELIKLIKTSRITGILPTKYNHFDGIFGPMADGKVAAFSNEVRVNGLQKNLSLNDINKLISINQFKQIIEIDRYFPIKNQLCLIDKQKINKYIKTKDIELEDLE